MSSEWYCTRDGKTKLGPFSPEQLKQLAASGMLTSADLVWKQGLPKWVAAGLVNGLFPQQERVEVTSPTPPPDATAIQGGVAQSDDDEGPFAETPTVGADLSNPLDRFAALMAVLWGLGSLSFLFLHVATGESVLLLLTFVSFIGGGIALGLLVRWTTTTQCPKCRHLWVKEQVDSTIVARQGGYDTVTRYQKDITGRIISTWEEQVHVTREGYHDAYRCRRCRYRWRGRSVQQFEG